MQKCLICIDSSSNKKRTRANKIFLKYGERVQYSVFEFYLSETDLLRLKNEITSAIDLEEDTHINIYYFPENYNLKIERLGKDNHKPFSDDEICYFS